MLNSFFKKKFFQNLEKMSKYAKFVYCYIFAFTTHVMFEFSFIIHWNNYQEFFQISSIYYGLMRITAAENPFYVVTEFWH